MLAVVVVGVGVRPTKLWSGKVALVVVVVVVVEVGVVLGAGLGSGAGIGTGVIDYEFRVPKYLFSEPLHYERCSELSWMKCKTSEAPFFIQS